MEMKNKILGKLFDFIWSIYPESLGTVVKNISGGWVFGKRIDCETREVVGYFLNNLNKSNHSIELWIKTSGS